MFNFIVDMATLFFFFGGGGDLMPFIITQLINICIICKVDALITY